MAKLIVLLSVVILSSYVTAESPEVVSNYIVSTRLMIENVMVNKVIDVPFHAAPGKDLGLWFGRRETNQIFILKPVSGNTYKIMYHGSNLYVQTLPGSVMVHLGVDSSDPRALWIFTSVGSNVYTIQNVATELYMQPVNTNIHKNSHHLAIGKSSRTNAQNWRLKFL